MATRKPKSKLAKQVFETHLHELRRLVELRGVGGLEKLFKAAKGDLYAQLRGFKKESQRATPTMLRATVAQIDGTLKILGDNLEAHLSNVARTASELGASHGLDEFRRLEKRFAGTVPTLSLDRAAVFNGMVEDVTSSLLRRHSLQAQTWSLGAVQAMERKLGTATLINKSQDKIIDDIMGAAGIVEEERWKAERIMRTEISYAHGATKFQSLLRTQEDLEHPLLKKLIATFDDRTGDDSFLLHGQAVPLTEPFVWKKKVRGAWVREEYMHPPNRPNDREVVIPWDPSWPESEVFERALTKAELRAAMPTRWRKTPGVEIPPGHRPGKPYR